MTGDIGRLRFCFCRQDVAGLVKFESGLAGRVVGASQKWAESPIFIQHWLAADRTFMLALVVCWDCLDHLAVPVAGTGKFAGWIRRATQEPSLFAKFVHELLTTLRAVILTGTDLSFSVLHLCKRGLEVLTEWDIKAPQNFQPIKVLLLDFVELLFHIAGKTDVHYLGEVLAEFVSDYLGQVGGEELFVPLLDIASLLNSAYYGSISAWPADAFAFERLN